MSERIAFCCVLLMSLAVMGGPTAATLPAAPPQGVTGELWARLTALDAKAAAIDDLTANFQQQKFTPLLKKPMVSSGTVLVKGQAMLWKTTDPQPTSMRVDEKQVSLYYPQEKIVEIYPVTGELSALASSPLPRLAMLVKHFHFAPATAKEMGLDEEPATQALRLTPSEPSLRQHVERVTVLIDGQRGFMVACELIDADGERTLIRFSHVKVNVSLDEAALRLELPPDVKQVHPLESLGSPPSEVPATSL